MEYQYLAALLGLFHMIALFWSSRRMAASLTAGKTEPLSKAAVWMSFCLSIIYFIIMIGLLVLVLVCSISAYLLLEGWGPPPPPPNLEQMVMRINYRVGRGLSPAYKKIINELWLH